MKVLSTFCLGPMFILWLASPEIRMDTKPVFTVSVFPNPIQGTFKVKVTGVNINEDILLEMYNNNGVVVYRRNFHAQNGTYVRSFQRPAVNAGIYIYRVIRKKTSQMVRGRVIIQ